MKEKERLKNWVLLLSGAVPSAEAHALAHRANGNERAALPPSKPVGGANHLKIPPCEFPKHRTQGRGLPPKRSCMLDMPDRLMMMLTHPASGSGTNSRRAAGGPARI